MSVNGTPSKVGRRRAAKLTLAALGVVFGDIGTSPLYTIKECFSEFTGLKPVHEDVLGILSLITWALIVIVTLKYVMVVMRADNRGEGGVLALMALVSRRAEISARRRTFYLMLGMAGAALFYGDCLLTPAISVLSAVEGLNTATPALEPLIIPLSLGVLFGLFAVQHYGTAGVGRWFGPIMLVWFFIILVLGLKQVVLFPSVLAALSPLQAVDFAIRHGFVAFVALGGGYSRRNRRRSALRRHGSFRRQADSRGLAGCRAAVASGELLRPGALLLADPTTLDNPFFLLAPGWALYPLVGLATAATVIASQATISGAFSMAQQAALLGLSPRVRITHTSASEHGQIYVPAINWMQLIGVVLLVLAFKSSTNLAAAYGIAVTGTMLVTTTLVFVLALRVWKWSLPRTIVVLGSFAIVDATLMAANMVKFLQGGWVPLALALFIFTAMWTWLKGRMAVAAREKEGSLPMETLLGSIGPGRVHRPQGTAVYLTAFSGNAPNGLLHNLKHNEVLHEQVVLLTVQVPDEPYVPPNARASVAHLGKGIHHVILRYGFMEQPDVPRDLAPLADRGVPFDPMRTSYFVGRNSFVEAAAPCCRAGRRNCSSCWLASRPTPATSSSCRPTVSSNWAAVSRSSCLVAAFDRWIGRKAIELFGSGLTDVFVRDEAPEGLGQRCLQGIKTVVERQERMPAEGDDDRFKVRDQTASSQLGVGHGRRLLCPKFTAVSAMFINLSGLGIEDDGRHIGLWVMLTPVALTH